MDTCLIQLIVPEGIGESISQWLENDVLDDWIVPLANEQVQHNFIVLRSDAEQIIDKLDNRYRQHEQYLLTLNNLELSLPLDDPSDVSESEGEIAHTPIKSTSRTVSRQELIATLNSTNKLNETYILMLLLSVAVACVGLINNNIAVVIAAMVIAPLLGPNIALALATSMVDYKFAWQAIKVGTTGAVIALIIALILGHFLPDTLLSSNEILARTHITYGDFILALAAGAAGTLAFTTGGSGTLIGVMVAVALLPPLLVFGFKLGNGEYIQAIGAGLLFTINFIGVNLAAVITFVLQGIRPPGWWKAAQARKTARIAIIIWALLLLSLLTAIYIFSEQF